jgi:hypothetical protein
MISQFNQPYRYLSKYNPIGFLSGSNRYCGVEITRELIDV